MDSATMQNLKTVKEATEILRCSRNTIYRWLTEGKIEGYQVCNSYWLIPDEELLRVISQGRNTANRNQARPEAATQLTPEQRMKELCKS